MDLDIDSPIFFVYKNKDEFFKKKLNFFNKLKQRIEISDTMICILMYSGIKEFYKYLKLNELIKSFLQELTNLQHNAWVEDVCWHIFKNVESSFESMPVLILKSFISSELEIYLYNLIKYNFVGISCKGFLDFIEEKNLYMEEDNDIVEQISSNNTETYEDSVPEEAEVENIYEIY